MSLVRQLLTQPSNEPHSLTCELCEFLFQSKAVASEDLLETEDAIPTWLILLQNNNNSQRLSNLIVNQLEQVGFSWATSVRDPRCKNEKAGEPLKTAFEAAFVYCSEESVQNIFQTLSDEQITTIRSNAKKLKHISYITALEAGRKDLADFLLKNSWDLEDPDENGATNLLRAPSWKTAQQLLEYGANVLICDHQKKTIWDQVKRWGSYKNSATEIVGQIKKYIKSVGASEARSKKDESIQALFEVVASQKHTQLKRRWNSLTKYNKGSSELVDVAGRSLARVGCDIVLSYNTQDIPKSALECFFHLTNLLYENDKKEAWIDLSRPLDGFPKWTERDHLMMTLSLMAFNYTAPLKLLGEDLYKNICNWQATDLLLRITDFSKWYITFVPSHDTLYDQRKFYELIAGPATGSTLLFAGVKKALLTVPPGNEWEQRVLNPMVNQWEQLKHGEEWSYKNNETNVMWAKRWADSVQPPAEHVVWDVLHMHFLHALKCQVLEPEASLNRLKYVYKTFFESQSYLHTRYRLALNAWVKNICEPNEKGVSLFESKRAKMDPEARALFENIFVQCAVDTLPLSINSQRKKM